MVGFVKRRFNLHKSKRGGTACLRDQTHGNETTTVVPWELMGKQWRCGGSVLCMWETSLLCRDSCLMLRTKPGSNTMC